MLANVDFSMVGRVDHTFDQRDVVDTRLVEESFYLVVEFAELLHVLIHVDEATVLVVERHGNEVRVEHLAVLGSHFAGFLFLANLIGQIFDGIDDKLRTTVLLFGHGIAEIGFPIGLLVGADINAYLYGEVAGIALDQHLVVLMEQLTLFGRHTADELFGQHAFIG